MVLPQMCWRLNGLQQKQLKTQLPALPVFFVANFILRMREYGNGVKNHCFHFSLYAHLTTSPGEWSVPVARHKSRYATGLLP